MNDETPEPFDTIGDEPVEARIVAWVLGESSAFEAAELERLCEERPELLVFRRRMRALHGLLTEAEAAEPDHSWKLAPEKRRALDEIFGEEEVVRLRPRREQGIRHGGRRVLLAIAACLMLAVCIFPFLPRKYESEAVIEVKPRGTGMSPFGTREAGAEAANMTSAQFFGTEFEKIRSSTSLAKVVDHLDLTNRWKVDKQTAIQMLKDDVSAENLRGTDLISIRVLGDNPEEAKDLTAEVAKAYKEYRTEAEARDAEKGLLELNKAVRDQEDKVEERRKLLATIVRTKKIIYTGQDSFYGQSGIEEDRQGARSTQEAYNKLQQDKISLESQINSLLKYDGDQLMVYGAGLDLPDNAIKNLYPLYLEATRQLGNLKKGGLAESHPQVASMEQSINTMKHQLDEGTVNLRATLQAKLDMASDSLKSMEVMKDNSREEAIKTGLGAQDYVDAKRDYEADQQLLQSMRLKQMGIVMAQNMTEDSVIFHEEPQAGSPKVVWLPKLGGGRSEGPNTSPAKHAEDTHKVDSMAMAKNRNVGLQQVAKQKQLANKQMSASATPPVSAAVGMPEIAEGKKMESMPGGTADSFAAGSVGGSGSGVGDAASQFSPTPTAAPVDAPAVNGVALELSSSKRYLQAAKSSSINDEKADDQERASGGPRAADEIVTRNNIDAILDNPSKPAESKKSKAMAGSGAADASADPSTATIARWDSTQEETLSDKDATGKDDKVRNGLYAAEGNLNLGKYGDSKKAYEDVLRTDPYNAAARRGLEKVATARSDFYRASYDQTRAELLSQTDSSWELKVPPTDFAPSPMGLRAGTSFDSSVAFTGGGSRSTDIDTDLYAEVSKWDDADLILGAEYKYSKFPELSKEMLPPGMESEYLFKAPDFMSKPEVKSALKDLAALTEEIPASENPYSTFSLNISDASFQLAKAALAKGERPDPASIKTEQFYNAVDYGDPAPGAGDPVAATIEQSAHPIIPGRSLVRVALRTGATGRSAVQPLHLTLLVDQSGSMVREDRRAAMDHALAQLGVLLTKNDVVTVIGFSRTPHLLSDAMTGDQAAKLSDLINQTANEGGTNLEEAMKLGAEMAERHQLSGAQNRIVLFTDGAANLGNADPDRLAQQVKALRQKGIAFDIAGIGADDLNDKLLSELARNGNGRYYVVGNEKDDSFARQLAGAFRPAAENVKVQVNFNPRRVGKYKLIGFDKDRLKTEDFRNDAVDAAELAAEEAGIAIYQIEPLPSGTGEIGEVSVRFRDASSKEMVERTWTISYDSQATAFDQAAPSMQLAGLSMLAAEKLRGGPLADAIDFKQLAGPTSLVKQFYSNSPRVGEMLQMIEKLK